MFKVHIWKDGMEMYALYMTVWAQRGKITFSKETSLIRSCGHAGYLMCTNKLIQEVDKVYIDPQGRIQGLKKRMHHNYNYNLAQ